MNCGTEMAKYADVRSLMADISPDKYPARWEEWYPEILSEYEKNGCKWTKKETYSALEAEYACFGELLELFCTAADECGKSEQLTLILMLLERSLACKDTRNEDLRQLPAIKSPSPEKPLAFRMLTGLAAATEIESAAELLKKRGFGKEIITKVLSAAMSAVNTYRRLYDGLDGFNLIDWCQRYFDGKLYYVGIFEVEFLKKFSEGYTVFASKAGEIKVLKDAVDFTGIECLDGGIEGEEKISLNPDEWHVVLDGSSDVIGLHIPRGHRLDGDAISDSFRKILDFQKEYFPELDCKAFVCSSWLLSADLPKVLAPETNIVRFSERFFRYKVCGSGNDVFNFVFCLPMDRVNIPKLPERTGLERGLKKLYSSGDVLREMAGFILI